MKRQLILSTSADFAKTKSEQFRLIKEAGFDGVFTFGDDEQIDKFAAELKELGLVYQSVHAPYIGSDLLWEEDDAKARVLLDKILFDLNKCIVNEIPLLVMHAYCGFEKHNPTQKGVDRFGEIVRAAEGTGVRLAFENTEGMEYLDMLMRSFSGERHVGFCWDSGHELCYNYSEDMLGKYGDRLFGTHLNDNLGIKDNADRITWYDDLHLLPFDGIADWQAKTAKLRALNFEGPLTFELNVSSKPNRHDNDKYMRMPIDMYLAEAYARACKIRRMFEG